MDNKLRNTAYIKIKHSINSCTNMQQLETLRNIVSNYASNKMDGSDLKEEFNKKEKELQDALNITVGYPEEEILNINHKRLEAK